MSLQIHYEVSDTRKQLTACSALLHACSLSSLPGSGDLHPMWHCSLWGISLSAGARGTAVHENPPVAVLLEGWSLWGCPPGGKLFSITEDTQVCGWAKESFVPVLRAPFLIGMYLPRHLAEMACYPGGLSTSKVTAPRLRCQPLCNHYM